MNLINKYNIPIAFITNSDNIELIIPNYTNYLAIENLMDPHNNKNYYKLKNWNLFKNSFNYNI